MIDGADTTTAALPPEEPDLPRAALLDGAVYRQVMSNFMSGVVVITTHSGDRDRPGLRGMTVSAVASLSLDPPMLLVCLNAASGTQEAVRTTGRYAVNILAEHQAELARRFARPGNDDKFDGVDVRKGITGVPVLSGALAVLECEVVEEVAGGTHRVFLSRVAHAEATDGSPLAYFRGTFGKLEIARDSQAYEDIRALVLSRELAPDSSLEVVALAERIGVPPSSVYYALTRLVGDDLVYRDPELGHLVRPVDVATSDDAHDAKCVIELGVADLTVGRLADRELGTFRRLAEETAAYVADGHLTDVDAFVAANSAFHAFAVEATGVTALAEAYRHLSLPDMMSRALTTSVEVSPDLTQDHLDLVDAYVAGDLALAKQIITAHNERAKTVQRAAIQRSGGRA